MAFLDPAHEGPKAVTRSKRLSSLIIPNLTAAV